MTRRAASSPLDLFHPAVREWFQASFQGPTPPQSLGWPAIARGESTLILAPTGSGKTLTAFLHCLDRLMFTPEPTKGERCRVLYVSPLKALAVDVERNLRAPLAGISRLAQARGDTYRQPIVAVRSGDTPTAERARFQRDPADILITTPESLYLMLTSNVREALRSVDTVIIDEIHALVPTKRGAHLALSLERLEVLTGKPVQRIGLSATQRPLDEIARFLGGASTPPPKPRRAKRKAAPGLPRAPASAGAPALAEVEEASETEIHDEFRDDSAALPEYRPVTLVDAGSKKTLELRIEVPVEDMSKLGKPEELPSGPASQGPRRASIWTAIHPRLLELIRERRSTLIFVNSRRISERLSAALNELAGEVLAQAHHGSLARAQRTEIEDNLKAGKVRALVATSSLELGIDMGAIDLVIQIESPPSVASAMQRIGRAGHQVDAPSSGVIFPKYRADLVACAAVTRAMHEGQVESTRYPRNPLDVLAQHIVAMVAMEPWEVDALFAAVRRAAPFAELSRGIFEGVLDMLAGRYVSDEFAELRPRVTWDRLKGTLTARDSARRVAVVNGGTIPDRGLYGVFLIGAEKGGGRVGELDEEMVFESRVGETFLLGASTWRIEEITHDRVLVSPAPGQPGKMPFWRGDAAGRPLEFGRAIGKLIRTLRQLPRGAALERLRTHHDLDPKAAENLLAYLEEQALATEAVPDDRTLVIERTRDELGDWRICVLSPLGGQIHAPWSMAAMAKAREELGQEVETMWTNDGFVLRLPESESPPDISFLLPEPEEVERLVLRQLGSTAMFAARFREVAARALLLPRRRPGGRTPLWQQRKRAADLLAVASRYGSFPMLLETYRECLRDIFDMPALVETLRDIRQRDIRVVTVDSATPSPFASSLLFGFVANYIYEGDAPLAERRAQALSIDQGQLRELLGEAELRELLDPDALADLARQLQHLEERQRVKSADGLHDLLLRIGDLSFEELRERAVDDAVAGAIHELVRARRVVPITLKGEARYIAVEDSARFRDALGVPLPTGLPEALLQPVPDPQGDLALRYARTHVPFTTDEFASRYGFSRPVAEVLLKRLEAAGRLVEGAFRPGGTQREWSDPEVLRAVRRRSLAKLRKEVEPVEPRVLGRMMAGWHGVLRKQAGMDALLDTIERLQGCALPASLLESELLPARVEGYSPADLDALASAGEVVWVGLEPLGEHDGRIALYLTDHLPRLFRPVESELNEKQQRIVELLRSRGASFFLNINLGMGGGFPAETVNALWDLVWKGVVTNDTFHALRAFTRGSPRLERRERRASTGRASPRAFRSRRAAPLTAEGRWSLVESRAQPRPTPTEWSAAVAQQLLSRYGVVTREVGAAESIPGGFSAVYDVFKALEESGRIRRGYFVSGVAAMQFALPGALDLLRSMRDEPEAPEVVMLAATDPANPYGALLKWPGAPEGEEGGAGKGPMRAVGAHVVLVSGGLAAYVSKGGRQVLVYLPESEPDRSRTAQAVATALATLATKGRREGMLIAEINGGPAHEHPLSMALTDAGFQPSNLGFHLRRGEPAMPKLRRPWGHGPNA